MKEYCIRTTDRPVSFTLAGSPLARVEPLTLQAAKDHLRFRSTSEDDLISSLIATVRALFEDATGRQTINAIYEYSLDKFPCSRRIQLPRPPLQTVESIAYIDPNGDEQTLDPELYRVLPSGVLDGSPASWTFDPHCRCGWIELAPTAVWPQTHALWREAVKIRRTVGYGETADAIPEIIASVHKLLVGHFFRNRSEVTSEPLRPLPMGASMILSSFQWTARQTVFPE